MEDLSLVESAFAAVGEPDIYLEVPDASNALAACEVLWNDSHKYGEWVAAVEELCQRLRA